MNVETLAQMATKESGPKVAYYYTTKEGRVVRGSVTQAICFATIPTTFPTMSDTHYIVYIPRFNTLPKELMFKFLEKVVKPHHWFAESIEEFDSERIIETRRVKIDGTKWSYMEILSTFVLIRYLDEAQLIVKEWDQLLKKKEIKADWEGFFTANKKYFNEGPYAGPYGGVNSNHTIFDGNCGLLRSKPALSQCGNYGTVPLSKYTFNHNDVLSMKKVFCK